MVRRGRPALAGLVVAVALVLGVLVSAPAGAAPTYDEAPQAKALQPADAFLRGFLRQVNRGERGQAKPYATKRVVKVSFGRLVKGSRYAIGQSICNHIYDTDRYDCGTEMVRKGKIVGLLYLNLVEPTPGSFLLTEAKATTGTLHR